MGMKRIVALVIISVFFARISAQEYTDSLTVDELANMSIEDLLSINIGIGATSVVGNDIYKTPSTISVIDKKTIDKYHFRSVTQAIQTLSNINVSRSYLKRDIPVARGILQDHYANKVLVMINGIPAWNAVTGEGNLSRIDISAVKQIEVLKGPASVLYGTNAYTAAINIVLENTDDNMVWGNSLLSSEGEIATSVNIAVKHRYFDLLVAAASTAGKGHKSEFTDEDSVTGYYNELHDVSNLSISLQGENQKIILNTFRTTESYLGAAPSFKMGAGNEHRIAGTLLNYEFFSTFQDDIELSMGATYDFQERDLSRSVTDSIRAHIKGDRTNAYIKLNYRFSPVLRANAGAVYEYRQAHEYRNYTKLTNKLAPYRWTNADTVLPGTNGMQGLSISETSAYAQMEADFRNISVITGVRYTKNENFGSNISGRISAVYTMNAKNSVKIMYGESYRSPSLFESNFFYATVLGNRNLKPETANSLELSYLTSFNYFFIQVLGYSSQYHNKMQRQLNTVLINDSTITMNRYTNGSMFNSKGIELELTYNNPGLINGFFNMSLVNGSHADDPNNTGHYNFRYVPAFSFSSGISKALRNINFSGLVNYTGKSKGPFSNIDAWYTLDLGISQSFKLGTAKISHSVSVNNLTNTRVFVPEFTRRKTLNAIPLGIYRELMYTVRFSL